MKPGRPSAPGSCARCASSRAVDPLALAGLDLIPGHRLQKSQCLENSPGILFVEREQIRLEFGIVEIQLNHVPPKCCSSAFRSAALGGSPMANKARSSRAEASGWWSQSSESGMVMSCLDHPHARLAAVDQHSAPGLLLAKRDLAAHANLLGHQPRGVHASNALMPA